MENHRFLVVIGVSSEKGGVKKEGGRGIRWVLRVRGFRRGGGEVFDFLRWISSMLLGFGLRGLIFGFAIWSC